MVELLFLVQNSPEGGYNGKAIGQSIFCEGNTVSELKINLVDAVKCHFEITNLPKMIRMRIIKDELIIL